MLITSQNKENVNVNSKTTNLPAKKAPLRRVSFASQEKTWVFDTEQSPMVNQVQPNANKVKGNLSPLAQKATSRNPSTPEKISVLDESAMQISPGLNSSNMSLDSPGGRSAFYSDDESSVGTLNSSFDSDFDDDNLTVENLIHEVESRNRDSRLSFRPDDEDMELTVSDGNILNVARPSIAPQEMMNNSRRMTMGDRMSMTENYGKILFISEEEEQESKEQIASRRLTLDNRRMTIGDRMSMTQNYGKILFVNEDEEQEQEEEEESIQLDTRRLTLADNRMSMTGNYGNILMVNEESTNHTEQNGISRRLTLADNRMSMATNDYGGLLYVDDGRSKVDMNRSVIDDDLSMELTTATGQVFMSQSQVNETKDSVLEEQTRDILQNIKRLSTLDQSHSINLSINNHSLISLQSPALGFHRRSDFNIVDDINGSHMGTTSFQISPPKTGVFDNADDFAHDSVICEDDEEDLIDDDGEVINYNLIDFMSQFQVPLFHDNVSSRRVTMIHLNNDNVEVPETREELLQCMTLVIPEYYALEKLKNDLSSHIELLTQKVAKAEANFENSNPPICTIAQHLPEQSSRERKMKQQLGLLRNMSKMKADQKLLDWKTEMLKEVYEHISNHQAKISNGDIRRLSKYRDHLVKLISDLEVTLRQEREYRVSQTPKASKQSSKSSHNEVRSPVVQQNQITHDIAQDNSSQLQHNEMAIYNVIRSVSSVWEPALISSSRICLRYKSIQQLGTDLLIVLNIDRDSVTFVSLQFENADRSFTEAQSNGYLQIRNSLVKDLVTSLSSQYQQQVKHGLTTSQIPALTKDIATRITRLVIICNELTESVHCCKGQILISLDQKLDDSPGVPISFCFSSRQSMKRFSVIMPISSDYPYEKCTYKFKNFVGTTKANRVNELMANVPFNRFGRIVAIAKVLSGLLTE